MRLMRYATVFSFGLALIAGLSSSAEAGVAGKSYDVTLISSSGIGYDTLTYEENRVLISVAEVDGNWHDAQLLGVLPVAVAFYGYQDPFSPLPEIVMTGIPFGSKLFGVGERSVGGLFFVIGSEIPARKR